MAGRFRLPATGRARGGGVEGQKKILRFRIAKEFAWEKKRVEVEK